MTIPECIDFETERIERATSGRFPARLDRRLDPPRGHGQMAGRGALAERVGHGVRNRRTHA